MQNKNKNKNKMNKLDKQYTDLLQDILDNGEIKQDRTGTGTKSVFGRQIRHDMKDGFPLLTTKKMPFNTIVTELLWFLQGNTNIKYLVENGCNIWNGDTYKNYCKFTSENDAKWNKWMRKNEDNSYSMYTMKEFIENVKTDDEFAKKWGELGPIYGKQWRQWSTMGKDQEINGMFTIEENKKFNSIDQIQNLINDLKTNPDSRRLMVSAWNVGELDQMVLPPCHYGFQVYTRELSYEERKKLCKISDRVYPNDTWMEENNIPTRTISLMWNQRSVDTFLGLPFNIASYGLLLMMIADEVNMVPDQLIGNLGDVHLYLNHLDAAKEQIGFELSLDERFKIHKKYITEDKLDLVWKMATTENLDKLGVPKRNREPLSLPKVIIRDGIYCSSIGDVILEDYVFHPAITAPLSN
jgi:thymidylate synthase